jgi:hypothetical protein
MESEEENSLVGEKPPVVITVLKERLQEKVMFDFGYEEFMKLDLRQKRESKRATKIDKIFQRRSKKLVVSANLTRPMMSLNESKRKIIN